MCLGTNVSGHKRVWAQSCLGTNVSGHKRVWAQSCLGTIVWAESCGLKYVWAQSCGLPLDKYISNFSASYKDHNTTTFWVSVS